MERIPHELPDEFPTEKPLIQRLTKTNYEFGRLAAAYDEVNRHICASNRKMRRLPTKCWKS